MNFDKKLRILIGLETLLLAIAGASALMNTYPYSWEIFSAILAGMITTFGLKQMRKLTSDNST
jgi:hypothetical protein